VDISANKTNFAAVTASGSVYALGSGSKGQLGDGTQPAFREALKPMALPPGASACKVHASTSPRTRCSCFPHAPFLPMRRVSREDTTRFPSEVNFLWCCAWMGGCLARAQTT